MSLGTPDETKPNPRPDASCRFVDWLTPGRFAVVLGILVFAAFPQVLLGSHSFAHRDYGLFGYPLAHYFRDSFWRGEVPLWNPYNELGIPFLAQWGTMVLYPPSLIYLLLPLPWSLSFFCLLHLFFGGMGMYVLATKWTGNRLAAGIAGLGFAFSGFTLNCLMWPNYTASLAWMPWVVHAVSLAWQKGGRQIVWASFAGALQMLSGTPEIILFTWLILAGLWVCTGVGTWREAVQSFRRFATISALTAALSAAQLLPFFELLSDSQRDSNFDKGQWPVPPWGWANLFVPMFRVYATACGVHFQYNQLFTSSTYSGIFIMLLVVPALLWSRDRRVFFLIGLATLSLLLSMGQHAGIYPVLRKAFPQLGFMRYASKFVIPMAWAWPLVGAFGFAALFRAPESVRSRLRVMAFAGLGLTALVAGIVLWARLTPFPAEDWSKTFMSGATRIALLIGTAASIVFLVRKQSGQHLWLLQSLALLLVWTDYMSHMPQQNPTLDREVLSVEIPREVSVHPGLGQSRAALSVNARVVFGHTGTSNFTETLLCLRNGLFADANLLEKIPKADGFFALSIKEARDVEYSLIGSGDEPRSGLGRFVGISHFTCATNLARWETRTGYMPMVTAGQQPMFLNEGRILAALTATNFAPESVAFLPEAVRNDVHALHSSAARVLSSRVREHRVEAEVETSQPALVVIAQAFYPPWRAFVDDSPVRLWRANHAFQALEVPSGRHQIKVVYIDRLFRLGSVISLLALAICIASYRIPGKSNHPTPNYGAC
jgi:hypothetical protein